MIILRSKTANLNKDLPIPGTVTTDHIPHYMFLQKFKTREVQ